MLSVRLLRLLTVQLTYGRAFSRACSTTSFNQTYSSYPDCAAPCLACKDSDYINNFANNCDYVSGDCCTSQYHSVIAATWACVRSICSVDVSQDAFDVFTQYCSHLGKPLANTDVPTGYNMTDASGNGTNNTDEYPATQDPSESADNNKLNSSDIAGIVVGTVGGLAAIIGSFYTWKQWRDKRRNNGRGDNRNNAALDLHRSQRPWDLVNVPPGIWAGNAGITAIYTRTTATFNLSSGYYSTEERFEVGRLGVGAGAGGRVVGEVA